MSSPETALVMIACPHCGTRYQLPFEAIGPKGRDVSCAHCGNSWPARAEPPAVPKVLDNRPLSVLAEEALDEKFANEEKRQKERLARREAKGDSADGAEEQRRKDHQRTLDEIKAAVGIPEPVEEPKPHDHKRHQREFSRRQQSLKSTLPRARMRRLMRLASMASVVVVIGGGIVFRCQVVQQFPQLAAPYAAIGMPVNIVGLSFRDVNTLKSLQNGAPVLVVHGKIANVTAHQAPVPQVIVTLVDNRSLPLYEWSMTAKTNLLEAGQVVSFETQLTAPPDGATGVQLTFADGTAAKQSLAQVAPQEVALDDTQATEDNATAGLGGQ